MKTKDLPGVVLLLWSATTYGSLDKTSKAKAGHPALKWPCAVVKYNCLSKGVIDSSTTTWNQLIE